MKEKIINEILSSMSYYLTSEQEDKLDVLLNDVLFNYDIRLHRDAFKDNDEIDYLNLFLTAKKIEGCTKRTINYYKVILNNLLSFLNVNIKDVTTDDIRGFINSYQSNNNISSISIDNMRRVYSSFFNWLESENYIVKSPMKRIHKIRTIKTVKSTYSLEVIQIMRDSCKSTRDLAIIDLLISTGIRVGELVNLNKTSIDFTNKECIVFGKGNKERRVYFDSITKIHLLNYLSTRNDDNEALFVSKLKPYNRLNISGVEIMLRKLSKELNITRIHPHKFRRTFATNAIDKGMPIEQVQILLGHSKIDTTMNYAMVDQNNVKNSYKKYLD